jgi:hypothetical protein
MRLEEDGRRITDSKSPLLGHLGAVIYLACRTNNPALLFNTDQSRKNHEGSERHAPRLGRPIYSSSFI